MAKEVSNWKNKKPKSFYDKAVNLLGEPIFVANVPHGMAYWKPRSGLFSEHMLKDEEIEHCVPAKHIDYFYSSVKCYVSPELRKQVLSISGSLNYDGLKKMITARCASMEANIATLFLAMSVANGDMSISHVKKSGLYGKYIRGEMESHSELKKKMMVLKKENHNRFEKELSQPLDQLAFPEC